ncbi:MAG: hypothetical protein AB8G26_18685 [Ilumatobacter sp.]
MARLLGPHRPGDPAYETLRAAAERLLDEADGAIHPKALELRLEDALAPELMVGERVDSVMLTSHEFGLDGSNMAAEPTSLGTPGVLAFTERRMIGAHTVGYVRLRRFVEAFSLDGDAMFRSVTPVVSGVQVRMFEVGNGQGWHRIFLPPAASDRRSRSAIDVPDAVIERWDRHIASRLAGAVRPRWANLTLDGFDDVSDELARSGRLAPPSGNPTSPPSAASSSVSPGDPAEPSGPLPRPDLSDEADWWQR